MFDRIPIIYIELSIFMTDAVEGTKRKFLVDGLQSQIQTILDKYERYFKIVRTDRRWLLMFIIARYPWGRALGTFFYSYYHKRNLAVKKNKQAKALDLDRPSSLFPELDVELAVRAIEQNGYYLGLKLPQNIVTELLDYAYSADISVDALPEIEFKYGDKERVASERDLDILVGNYIDAKTECEALIKLKSDPQLRAIAARYLKSNPILVRCQMGWTFIGDEQAYSQKGALGSPTILFHYDLDDYRALKFFFYLTDVDSLSGSHRCVAGSHRKRKLVHYLKRGQSDREIIDFYGEESIIDICGSAGFGFAEDPFCFHRGSPPVTSPRLMIQLEFAFNDYGMWN